MKTGLLIFIIILSNLSLKGQIAKIQSPEYRAEGMTGVINANVKLTNKQIATVNRIYVNHFRLTDSLRNASLNPKPNSKVMQPATLMALFNQAQLETDEKVNSIPKSSIWEIC